jgi:AbrB family looped-hinge helix DNA binding protein
MPSAPKLTTTISTKGQVILPAAIRKRQHWNPGTRLTVEETSEGVLLRPAPLFVATTPERVFGCLRYEGTPKSLEDMRQGIAAEALRRHARGRY